VTSAQITAPPSLKQGDRLAGRRHHLEALAPETGVIAWLRGPPAGHRTRASPNKPRDVGREEKRRSSDSGEKRKTQQQEASQRRRNNQNPNQNENRLPIVAEVPPSRMSGPLFRRQALTEVTATSPKLLVFRQREGLTVRAPEPHGLAPDLQVEQLGAAIRLPVHSAAVPSREAVRSAT